MTCFELISLIINAISALAAIILTTIIIVQTNINNRKNTEIQMKIAEQDTRLQIKIATEQNKFQHDNLKIALYDKRLESYDVLFKIYSLAPLYKSLFIDKINNGESISFIKEDISRWMEFFGNKAYIAQFLFNDEIQETLKKISAYIIKIDVNLTLCVNESISQEHIKDIAQIILTSFDRLIEIFDNSNIFNHIGEYLQLNNL